MPGHTRILLVRTDRLGDVILTLPMLPLIRKAYPQAYIGLLLQRYTGEIVKGNPFADRLLWYDDEAGRIPFLKMLGALRRERFDSVVVVHPTFRLAVLMFLAGIPVRIGTGYRAYSFLFNRRVYEHRKDAKRHELEYNLNLLKELDCAPPETGFRPEFAIVIPEPARSSAEEVLRSFGIDGSRPLAVLHPGSGGSAREWPLQSFGELGATLSGRFDVVITGNEAEKDRAAEVVRLCEGRAVALAGRTGLAELAGILTHAAVLVSNSTGPLHLAVAVGTPVVGLYPQHPPMSARRWGPYAANTRVLSPDRPTDCMDCVETRGSGCACMASIPVSRVLEAVEELLKRQPRRTENVFHE